jgi:hypothetical protein
MDLSKAFDCLPHKLLINKLDAYGVSESALKLIKNYLSNRKQCVKISNIMSEWEDIYKGVPDRNAERRMKHLVKEGHSLLIYCSYVNTRN